MSSLYNETMRILRNRRLRLKKRMGQSLLIDEAVLDKMVDYADLRGGEVVLEVGSGLGFLTRRLAEVCGRVIGVEVDPRLFSILRDKLGIYRNVDLICGDILNVDVPEFDKVVSTPPYSISTKLTFWLLERRFDLAVLTLQEEFANRLAAPVGSKDYGRLTVMVYYRAEVEGKDKIPRSSFYPPPKVDSKILTIKPRGPPFQVSDLNLYNKLVKALFTQRNRKLRNALIPFLRSLGLSAEEAKDMALNMPFSNFRVRSLAPEDFGMLNERIKEELENHILR